MVGFRYQLEMLLGDRISRIAVGMILESKLPESLLDLFKGGSLFEPQDFVIVPTAHNINSLWCDLQLIVYYLFRGITPMDKSFIASCNDNVLSA